MNTQDPQLPPLALALGRLRQARPSPRATWPFAARPAGEPAPEETRPPPPFATPEHDFLRVLPEPALTGELPPSRPAAPEVSNRLYWFDL